MVDNAELVVNGGNGGTGAVSGHREKFVPRGGPDGGDGGNGGDVILEADSNIEDLAWFKSRRSFHAEKGQPGGSNKKSGRNGADLVIKVPVGTMAWNIGRGPDKTLLADLSWDGAKVKVAVGGRGGWGNMHFATPSRQMPMKAKAGTGGEQRNLELEMRLLADIVLVGPPNTGKSTLLKSISRAPAVVAEYPFSTTEPVLGTVDLVKKNVVVVELPGVVPGSHAGRGLGNRFLRHAQRAGALVYVLAGDSDDPVADYATVKDELRLYDNSLVGKRQIVVVNKADLSEVQDKVPTLKRRFKKFGAEVDFISARTGQGVRELIEKAANVAAEVEKAGAEVIAESPVVVFRPKPKQRKS